MKKLPLKKWKAYLDALEELGTEVEIICVDGVFALGIEDLYFERWFDTKEQAEARLEQVKSKISK